MKKVKDIVLDTKLLYEKLKKKRKISRFEELPEHIQEKILKETFLIKAQKYLLGSYINGSYSDSENTILTYYREFFGKKKESDIDIMIENFNKDVKYNNIHILPFDKKTRKILIPNKK